MESASLVVAICGVILGSLSLGWQVANHVLTGGQVTVALRAGAIGRDGLVTVPPGDIAEGWFTGLAGQGFPRPVVAVQVANIGQQPVTVTRWSLQHWLGTSFVPAAVSVGRPLPCQLDVGESEMWAVDLQAVTAWVKATEETFGEIPRPEPSTVAEAFRRGMEEADAEAGNPPRGFVAVLELADGRTRRSPRLAVCQ
ncbi:MAG TPA: hypothetical protein VFM55_21260 [Micromonosporaceae bacterium]|nr:hypothetical protein [Micromonosporaceae bacterium]